MMKQTTLATTQTRVGNNSDNTDSLDGQHGNKRPLEATESSFENQFSQRRVRKRLERQAREGQQGGNTSNPRAESNRNDLATSHWNRALREGIERKQHVGNKVLVIGNKQKCVSIKGGDPQVQKSMKDFFKKIAKE